MSSQLISPAVASAADRDYLIRQSMSTGYQYFSLLMPPLYTAVVLSRRRMGALPWSINRMLRATWIGGAAGIMQGGAFEYFRTSNQNEEILRARRINAMYNVTLHDNTLYSLRAQDHSTIGAILGALLTPAVFWKRARSIHRE
ncbi:uncharacterized protein FOMMEDRAFT_78337 [Fomitiporia mediterranea MF3/22]|uniref:uncharacterized protein n=1 Tax=Fomitiporia mediterranea (strain MF3/22) TaxID=694068 RepID=UPI0004407575|nr:uncharacterized protein FOMMEDRAFT_78337 [Fomitiporia mediterranea MF3/22]EJD05714.1 hypothetical protein FOMMEDRAFT_78337 [Fomitiporia mediterranea MF3/22]